MKGQGVGMSANTPQTAIKYPLFVLVTALLITLAGQEKALGRDWLVPSQAPTIQSAVDSCVSGDVVVVAPGIYTDCTHLNGNNVPHIAILQPGVSLRGETGDPADVVLDAGRQGRCIEIRNCAAGVSVEGVTLLRGQASNPFGSGGGVFSFQSTTVFRSCVFDSCNADFAGGAISAGYGGLTLEDCVIQACGTENIGGAVRTTAATLDIIGCTIQGTHGAGIHYATHGPVISNTIIADGDAAAIARNTSNDPAASMFCCDLYGNQENWPVFLISLLGTEGNIEADPMFCNPLFGDLNLHMISPCAPDNSASCGLIGALDVACGAGAGTYLIQPDGTGDFPTIQEAINAVAEGDTIALDDGTFTGTGNRDLDFLGKGIVVTGRSKDANLVVIDCQGSPSEPHRGFYFHSGEIGTSTLEYVTITNADVADNGAGILCESSPRISGCRLIGNHAAMGAGIYCQGGSPVITGCAFVENEGRSRAGGVGLFSSRAVLTDCLFTRNWGYMGSAVFLPDSSAVTLVGCTLTANNSSIDKACVGVGGNSSLTLDRTQITFGNRRAARCYDQGTLTATACDIYQNAEGDYTDCLAAQSNAAGNLSLDPLYCDAGADDFEVRADSPCAAINTVSGLPIGAFGAGCPAPSVFTSVSGALPPLSGRGGGVSWIDFNLDGALDLFVAHRDTTNELLAGTGGDLFVAHVDTLASFSGPALGGAWGDYDNDGDPDLYMINDREINFLLNNQQGHFNWVVLNGVQDAGAGAGCSWADYNNDGNLDLYLAAMDTTGRLFQGNGAGALVDVTVWPLTQTAGVVQSVWADYDNDGQRDLYLVRDGQPNQLFHNVGLFEDAGITAVQDAGSGRDAAWGDYDNDGDLDLYLTNANTANVLWRNDGNGSFTQVTAPALQDAGPGRSGIWGDWDNDGDLDLFLANCGTADRLLRNDGGGLFIDTADSIFAAADSSMGAAWGDYDKDGDLDLVVADRSGPTRLYRNDGAAQRHWLEIDLHAASGMVGCPGARIRIVTADSLVQIREAGSSGGMWSSDAMTVHFGLGDATVVDTLQVTWPGGVKHLQYGVAADQVLTVSESLASPVPFDGNTPGASGLRVMSCAPNPFNPATTLKFTTGLAGRVTVTVFDVAGRKVRDLLDEVLPAGGHEVRWRGQDDKGRAAATGIYFLRVKAGDQVQVVRGALVK